MTVLKQGGEGLFLDGTLGGGGHAHALLTACANCRVLGVDKDPRALDRARVRLEEFGTRIRFRQGSFHLAVEDPEVRKEGLAGALLDLGVSSHQLDDDSRGFTIRPGAPLDMRMGEEGATAMEYLAEVSERSLIRDLTRGDAPKPRPLARSVVRRRQSRPLKTSDDLVGALEAALRRPATHAEKARTFQAVRIAVNGELDALGDALPAIREALRPGGVLVVLSYHSGEDAGVKKAFRDWSDPGWGIPAKVPLRADETAALGDTLTRRPVVASDRETELNPRARPARLRAWRKAS
ncbi:MAG: 16S rRNA (cytosine(1402)-N(4))-methyltransferase RsmH [Gemmatimonadetes bacterium]|nr:16S rRNA (cytosine(1402)-N(4))-methyltransferase RsmH [Gemmatimonadota bacterium]